MWLFFPGFGCILALIFAYLYSFIQYLSSDYPDTWICFCYSCSGIVPRTGYLDMFLQYLSGYSPDTCAGLG